MKDIGYCYGGLSPENLCCDGEASLVHIRRTAARLKRQLRALFTELGRTVTEDQYYGDLMRKKGSLTG